MNQLQKRILDIAFDHVGVSKTPITLREISNNLRDIKPRTVRASAESLVTKGYFRHGIKVKNNICYIITITRGMYYGTEHKEE